MGGSKSKSAIISIFSIKYRKGTYKQLRWKYSLKIITPYMDLQTS